MISFFRRSSFVLFLFVFFNFAQFSDQNAIPLKLYVRVCAIYLLEPQRKSERKVICGCSECIICITNAPFTVGDRHCLCTSTKQSRETPSCASLVSVACVRACLCLNQFWNFYYARTSALHSMWHILLFLIFFSLPLWKSWFTIAFFPFKMSVQTFCGFDARR